MTKAEWAVGLPMICMGVAAVIPKEKHMVEETFPSDSLLETIVLVESSHNPKAVSGKGARGLYQFMPATWADMTTLPFDNAFDPRISKHIAVKYLLWIRDTLREWEQKEDIPLRHVLSCWHGGIGRFRKGGYQPIKMPASTKVFVNRVLKLKGRTNGNAACRCQTDS